MLVIQSTGLKLDSNAALALDIHIVKQLTFHIALTDRSRLFNQTVGKRALAVVDMGYYRKVSYMFFVQKTPRNGVRNKIRRNLV